MTRWFVDKWGKPLIRQKLPPSDFKVTTPKNPLINNQAVISIRNLTTTLAYPEILTYNWTFTPILNWTWSYSSLLSFIAQISNLWLTHLHKSQYVTNFSNLNGCWLQSSPLHQQWRSGSTWLQNPMAYKCNSFSQRKLKSWSLYPCVTTPKISLIYDLGCKKRNPNHSSHHGPN